MDLDNWDYIIIGAGSSGCAVAYELSASGDKRVLLLEAGSSNRSMIFKIPLAAVNLDMRRFDWGYESAPDPTRHGKSEKWIRGRVLGGSSSINGMNYVRGSPADFDRWESMGNVGWDAKSIMPLFRDLERCDSSIPDSEMRGRDGLLHVRMVKERHFVTDAFIESAQTAGYRFIADYNGASQEGIGYAQLSQRGRRRWSSADAFLKAALEKSNFKVLVNAHVHKLLIRDRSVVGVRYKRDGQFHEVRAGRVILCGGAINTPQLLMLSGIGDADVLRKNGVDVVSDCRGVGENLTEHPTVKLVYRMRVPTYNLTEGPLQKVQLLAKYLMRGQGPLACLFESIAFLKTTPREPKPDVQLHVAAFGYDDIVSLGARAVPQLLPYPSMTIFMTQNHPISRGRIVLRNSNPDQAPVIEPRLLDCEADVGTLARGVEMVRRIMAAQPIAPLVREEIKPGKLHELQSVEGYVKENTQVTYHPSGTCRMGVDERAVVTPDLKVRGIENLWIADASVMPDLISGNTNAVCMMIGIKLGRQLARETRKYPVPTGCSYGTAE